MDTSKGTLTQVIERLPLDPAAARRLIELARDQDASVQQALLGTLAALEPRLAQTAPERDDLEALLTSASGYRQKVDVLLHAQKMRDPRAADVVRRLIANEEHPFVLATMASTLGRLGGRQDGPQLNALLAHADARVASNALEALDALGVPVSTRSLDGLLARTDERLRCAALLVIAKTAPERVMEVLPSFLLSPAAATRGRAAYMLGEMRDSSEALSLLLGLLERETDSAVLRQIGEALKKHVSPLTATMLIGRLYELRQRLGGATRVLVQMVLQEVAVQLGLVEAQVREAGERWIARSRVTSGKLPTISISDADLPLSFSAVWGDRGSDPKQKRPALPPKRSVVTTPATPPPPPPPAWRLPVAAAGLALVVLGACLQQSSASPAPEPRAAAHVAAKPGAPSPKPAAAVAAAPKHFRSSGWSGGLRPDAPEAHLPELPAIGSVVDLEGDVAMRVGPYPVIRSQGRNWMLRGPAARGLGVGRPCRVKGVLAGEGPNGLAYVDILEA